MATPQPETKDNGQPLVQPQLLQIDGQVEKYDTQIQGGDAEDNVNRDGNGEAEGGTGAKTGGQPREEEKTKNKRRAAVTLEHERGKSIFPVSRVQRIMKADKVRT